MIAVIIADGRKHINGEVHKSLLKVQDGLTSTPVFALDRQCVEIIVAGDQHSIEPLRQRRQQKIDI